MSQKTIDIIVKIIKVGLCVLPAATLIVGGNFFANIFLPGVGDLFFPFITGKNFFFRIVVEILFALWALAAIFDKRFRPTLSPVFWAVSATLVILVLSTIFGENPYRSFWSNYERMEGLVGHLHLFAYFVMLIGVFKSQTDWRRFFYSSIAVSFIITTYSYLQFMGRLEIHQSSDRLDATLGNATYLAIYIIFHLALLAYYLFQPARQLAGGEKRVWIKGLFAALIVLETPIVFLTATRGAILGLMGGAVLFALLLALLDWGAKSRLYKLVAAGLVAAVFLMVGAFFALKNTNFVQKNYVLSRFAQLSPQEQTTKSRFTIWSMALEGFQEHPVLGVGLENFNLVFNKHYKAMLWPQEPWFDRAHNVFFDWLAQGGALGLIAYLGIFIAAIFTLWKNQSDKFATAAFTSLFAAYFFHNLFVFDNLTSYFIFFSVLGFVQFLGSVQQRDFRPPAESFAKYVAVIFVFLAVLFSLYFLNFKPLLANQRLLDALKGMATDSGNVDKVLADFDRVFELKTFGNGEAREQLAGYANKIAGFNVPMELKVKAVQKAVSEMERQVAENPKDARAYLFLSALYLKIGRIDDGLAILAKAHELSPQKQQIYFLLADAHITKGDNKKALEILQEAYDLDPTYGEAVRNLALAAIINGDENYAEKVLSKVFKNGITNDQNLLAAYARVGNYKKVRDIWLLFIKLEPQNAQYRVSLAATYMQLGERQNAIKELQKAIELNPQFKPQGEYFIEEIRAGRNPQ
ncbi:MAG: O-antigen ligase family protein [Candidatus Giovannonibacteria bacterium]|nr:MAG: O-antigen ligase family protein [Candidatus Giovannonibacteria bacterium]